MQMRFSHVGDDTPSSPVQVVVRSVRSMLSVKVALTFALLESGCHMFDLMLFCVQARPIVFESIHH